MQKMRDLIKNILKAIYSTFQYYVHHHHHLDNYIIYLFSIKCYLTISLEKLFHRKKKSIALYSSMHIYVGFTVRVGAKLRC